MFSPRLAQAVFITPGLENPERESAVKTKPKRYTTTNADLSVFEKECRRIGKLWGLNSWNLSFLIGCGASDDVAAAAVETDVPQRDATLKLASWFKKKPTQKQIRGWARHEMIHVVMEPLESFASWRYVSHKDEITGAVHETLAVLDKLLPR